MNDALQVLLDIEGWGELSDWARPLAYGLAAMVCALLGTSQSLARHTPARVQQLWLGLCPLYLLIATSCLVKGDVLWVQWARDFAREQHLYGERRLFQLAALLALVLLAWATWQQYLRVQRNTAVRPSVLRNILLTGASGTLVLYLLRYVSFHYTDLALNAILFDHSVASWVEFTSLGLASLGTSLELLRSYGHV